VHYIQGIFSTRKLKSWQGYNMPLDLSRSSPAGLNNSIVSLRRHYSRARASPEGSASTTGSAPAATPAAICTLPPTRGPRRCAGLCETLCATHTRGHPPSVPPAKGSAADALEAAAGRDGAQGQRSSARHSGRGFQASLTKRAPFCSGQI
jgi:hypothetical protein